MYIHMWTELLCLIRRHALVSGTFSSVWRLPSILHSRKHRLPFSWLKCCKWLVRSHRSSRDSRKVEVKEDVYRLWGKSRVNFTRKWLNNRIRIPSYLCEWFLVDDGYRPSNIQRSPGRASGCGFCRGTSRITQWLFAVCYFSVQNSIWMCTWTGCWPQAIDCRIRDVTGLAVFKTN